MLIWLGIFLIIAPILIGAWITLPIKKEYSENISYWYIVGIMFLLALFQMICIPMAFLKMSFETLVAGYSIVVIICCVISVWCNHKRLLEKVRAIHIGKISGFELVAVCLILLQIGTSVIATPEYAHSGDDTTYITMAGDAIRSNTIYLTDYMTGEPCTLLAVSPKYTLTSYNMFTAYLAQIGGVHVLPLCKTILPVFVIGLAYLIYARLGAYLFGNDRKKVGVFLCLLSVLNIFSGFSNYTLTFRLLVCMWQGKAILAAIVLPFLFYQMFIMFEEKDTWAEYLVVVSALLAASSATLMGVGLAPILFMIGVLLQFLKKRNWKIVFKSGLCCVPCVFYLAIYVFYGTIITVLSSYGIW